ncbi:hypothetical protein [Sphingomonas solaris]|uniref:Uncharacterized protein n=1 Tax=Alterirhizorhabdus solaris TaxID=2529389 RepID=A0A558RAM0_9SPHN|nr:hypothetical protein [Sphingomonas solaris]TVV76417.1 hypothetical protein FOY91_04110 [Sphingomonas solaris]
MTITFRIDDGFDAREPGPAIITVHQLGSLRDLLAAQTVRLGSPLILPEYGDPSEADFSFDARVCPLALAMVSACFDHYPDAIAVLDEAQFRGRRVRVWRYGPTRDIHLSLSSNPDSAPELKVANCNAYALLETLGLEPDSVGVVPVTELRQRLTDPRIRQRLDDDPQLSRYVPTLVAMASL